MIREDLAQATQGEAQISPSGSLVEVAPQQPGQLRPALGRFGEREADQEGSALGGDQIGHDPIAHGDVGGTERSNPQLLDHGYGSIGEVLARRGA